MPDYRASTRHPPRPRPRFTWSLLLHVGVVGALVVAPVLIGGQAQATPAARASAVTPTWETVSSFPDYSEQGRAIAVDPVSGIVVVAGSVKVQASLFENLLVIAYDAGGTQLWSNRIAGTNHDFPDTVGGVAIDSVRGRVYVTGSVTSFGDRASGVTVAYDLAGRELWRADYDEGEREEYLSAPVVDPVTGLVIVGGKSSGDAVLLAYTPSGDLAWSRRLGFAPYEDEIIGAPVLAPDGSGVYVQGYSEGVVVIALDTRGRTGWLAQVPPDQDSDVSSPLAISPDGAQLYLGLGDGFHFASVTALATVDGSLRWTREILELLDGVVRGVDLVVDPSTGNVFTAVNYGYVQPKPRDSFLTNAFEADGSLLWTRTLYDRDQGIANEYAMTVSPVSDDLIFAGRASKFDRDPYLGYSKYSVQFLDKATGANDGGYSFGEDVDLGGIAFAVTVDTVAQRAYVTGRAYDANNSEEVVTVCFDLS